MRCTFHNQPFPPLDCSPALPFALPAALVQEKRGWLEKLAAAEAEAERFRNEAQQLRLRLLPSGADEQVSGLGREGTMPAG